MSDNVSCEWTGPSYDDITVRIGLFAMTGTRFLEHLLDAYKWKSEHLVALHQHNVACTFADGLGMHVGACRLDSEGDFTVTLYRTRVAYGLEAVRNEVLAALERSAAPPV